MNNLCIFQNYLFTKIDAHQTQKAILISSRQNLNDDFLLELAVKSNSIIVTLNGKDFKPASEFGLKVMTPKEFLQYIGEIS